MRTVRRVRLSEALALWIDHRRIVEDWAPTTVTENRMAIERLIYGVMDHSTKERSGGIGDLWTTELAIDSFQPALARLQPMSRSYNNTQRNMYRLFWNYLQDESLLSSSMMKIRIKDKIRDLRKPRNAQEAQHEIDDDTFIISPDRFPEFIYVSEQIHPRHAAFNLAGIFRGNRGKALHDLRIKDIDWENKRFRCYESKTSKYDKSMPMRQAWWFIEKWLTLYEKMCGPLDPEWRVFPTLYPHMDHVYGVQHIRPDGAPTNPERIIRKIVEGMGYTQEEIKRVGTHTLRRSAATYWYWMAKQDPSIPSAIEFVMSITGHSTREQAYNYIRVSVKNEERDNFMDRVDFFADPNWRKFFPEMFAEQELAPVKVKKVHSFKRTPTKPKRHLHLVA